MSTPLTTPSNPYVGPRSFQTGEALYGRDREVRELLGLLIAERIVLLHSPSGAGKTSLVQAALIPRLQEREFTVLPVMRVSLDPPLVSSPSSVVSGAGVRDNGQQTTDNGQSAQHANRYILSLLLSLEEGLPLQEQTPIEQLVSLSLAEYLERRPRAGDSGGEVLIFDQFEEILTIEPTDLAAKTAFFAQIGAALRDRRRWALFSMRDDYVAALAPYLRAIPTRLNCTYRLDLLGAAAAHAAIREPAGLLSVDFEDAAAARLIDDLRQVQVQRSDGSIEEQFGPWVEPVQLQVVCYRLWEQHFNGHSAEPPAETDHITSADVESLGDVNRALADYYAERVAATAASTGISERAIREWFDRRLITPQGIRGQVLQAHGQSEGLDNRAIWPLIDTYLVRAEKRRGATWFELAHDRLIEPVREDNIAWRVANLSALQRQADLWDSQGRPDGLLLRDAALVEAETWAAAHAVDLTPVEQDLLDRCREVREIVRRARRTNRIIRRLAIVAGVISIVAIVAAWLAFKARDDAERARAAADQARAAADQARDDAEQARTAAEQARTDAEKARDEAIARQLAAQSYGAKEQTPQRALLLGIEAVSHQGSPHLAVAESALYDALTSAGGLPLYGHTDDITALAFSPDGHALASGSADHTVRLWSLSRPGAVPSAPRLLSGHTQPITALAFSPDGRTLATASRDGSVRLWSVTAPADAPVTLSHNKAVISLAFSPDGRTLATASADGSVRLWNMAQPTAAPAVLAKSTAPVNVVAFSPDGRTLAAAGDDAIVRLWDMARPTSAPDERSGHEGPIRALAFSRDGRVLATASDDTTARLWDVRQPSDSSIVLEGHHEEVTILAFSPDGHTLATGSHDRTVQLWNTDNLNREPNAGRVPRPLVLSGHTSAITGLVFTPDGRSLVSASHDGTARLWDIRRPGVTLAVLRGHGGSIAALALGPDGHTLASGSDDRTVRIWNLGTSSAIPKLQDRESMIATLALSPDGRTLATGSTPEGIVRIWNRDDLGPGPTTLGQHQERINVMAFSPDGKTLASGSNDRTIRLWDLSNPRASPVELRGHAEGIAALLFSSDGQSLLTASFDGAVLRWNLGTKASTAVLPANQEGATVMAFSPDGHYLATDSASRTALLWDLTQPDAAPIELRGHEQGITALAFSPDGRTLATGSIDRTVRLWDVADITAEPRVLRGHAAGILVMAFSPDGHTLATGSADTTIRLWDPANSAEPIVLTGHADSPNALAFSSDGQTLVSSDVDRTIWLWPTQEGKLIAQACATAGRNLTWDEWQEALGDLPYRKTCANLPVSPSLIDTAASRADADDIEGALELSKLVSDLGAADEIPARSWGQFCRAGSLAGHAAELHDACDRAVALAPDDGAVHDSRGLARALTKDTSGAIEDFNAYVAWARQNGEDAERIAQREAWIADLEAGRDPFSPAVLDELRSE
jgi:WD40 repeat protein